MLTVLEDLAKRNGSSGYVLPLGRVKSRPAVAERKFIKSLKGLSGVVGIPVDRLTLHRFRNYFVCECAETSVPMPTIMEWVGHDEMSVVIHYYSLRDHSARGAMRRLSGSMATSTCNGDQEPECVIVVFRVIGNDSSIEFERTARRASERIVTLGDGFSPSRCSRIRRG